MSGTGSSSFSGTAKRYEVQFQKDSQRHSDTNNLEQATLYACSLANWNLAAQVCISDQAQRLHIHLVQSLLL